MNRRAFLGTLGVFSILPGAGRVRRAVRPTPKATRLYAYWYQTKRTMCYMTDEYRQAFEKLARNAIPEDAVYVRDPMPPNISDYERFSSEDAADPEPSVGKLRDLVDELTVRT